MATYRRDHLPEASGGTKPHHHYIPSALPYERKQIYEEDMQVDNFSDQDVKEKKTSVSCVSHVTECSSSQALCVRED
jgi:hypothetical protein